MKAISIKIHNFRTITDIEIILSSYALLVGANNSGKSNFIDAIRVFYEKIAFNADSDFPKFKTQDDESWIEIQYKPTPEEFAALKTEYKLPDGTFRVRKYFKTSQLDSDNKPKLGIFAYETSGQLSESRFYGTKNVQQGKLGEVIYIPAVTKLDEHTKLSGPSALRELINSVLRKVIDGSVAYSSLITAFEEFGGKIKSETNSDGNSLLKIESEISAEIEGWGTSFELVVNPITTDDIVKSLIGPQIQEKALGNSMDPSNFGQGFQRHLIFSLIKLSARHTSAAKVINSKDFSPRLTWLLFEEPEAFLHPSQIDVLDVSLRQISRDDNGQVLITTHSPEFVSKNIEDLPSMIRLCKNGTVTTTGQVTNAVLQSILSYNQQEVAKWQSSGIYVSPDDMSIDMESIKYALWLDPRRCSAFFANKVLLVEGPTESAVIGYLLGVGQLSSPVGGVFIMDTIGKFNTHRFMRLFGELGISHAVLYDLDNGNKLEIDKTIAITKNAYTIGIDSFPVDLETFLGVPQTDKHRKPQHIMWHLRQGKIAKSKLDKLALKVQKLLGL